MSDQAKALLNREMPMLKSYARHLMSTSHDADDLVQDVCLAVLVSPHLLLNGADAGAYLRGIARHLARRRQRQIQREPTLEEVIELSWDSRQQSAADDRERQALSECLGGLSEKVRTMLAWRYQKCLQTSNIASMLGITDIAVRVTLTRVRQSLAKCLKQKLSATGRRQA